MEAWQALAIGIGLITRTKMIKSPGSKEESTQLSKSIGHPNQYPWKNAQLKRSPTASDFFRNSPNKQRQATEVRTRHNDAGPFAIRLLGLLLGEREVQTG